MAFRPGVSKLVLLIILVLLAFAGYLVWKGNLKFVRTLSPLSNTQAQPTHPERATLLYPNKLYYASQYESPGKVFVGDPTSDTSVPLFQVNVNVGTFSFHPYIPEKVYYADRNGYNLYLYMLGSGDRGIVFTHNNRINCVRYVKESGGLGVYFSEAYGGGADGKIYKIENNVATLFMEVRLRDLGHWAGDFDLDGRGNVYLSNGNLDPSSLYVYSGGNLRMIARLNTPASGLRYANNVRLRTSSGEITTEGLFFSGHDHIVYFYDLNSGKVYQVFKDTSLRKITDIAFRG